jgi:hypothetical protein
VDCSSESGEGMVVEEDSEIDVKTLHAKIGELVPTNDFCPVRMLASLRSLQTSDCDGRTVAAQFQKCEA